MVLAEPPVIPSTTIQPQRRVRLTLGARSTVAGSSVATAPSTSTSLSIRAPSSRSQEGQNSTSGDEDEDDNVVKGKQPALSDKAKGKQPARSQEPPAQVRTSARVQILAARGRGRATARGFAPSSFASAPGGRFPAR